VDVAVNVGVYVRVYVKVGVAVTVGVTVGVPQYTLTTTSFESSGSIGSFPSMAATFVIGKHPFTTPHHVYDPPSS
jgi:hypothetical protein